MIVVYLLMFDKERKLRSRVQREYVAERVYGGPALQGAEGLAYIQALGTNSDYVFTDGMSLRVVNVSRMEYCHVICNVHCAGKVFRIDEERGITNRLSCWINEGLQVIPTSPFEFNEYGWETILDKVGKVNVSKIKCPLMALCRCNELCCADRLDIFLDTYLELSRLCA